MIEKKASELKSGGLFKFSRDSDYKFMAVKNGYIDNCGKRPAGYVCIETPDGDACDGRLYEFMSEAKVFVEDKCG